MSNAKISYAEALSGVVTPEDVEGMIGLLEQHKNWGAFTARLPSYIVVNLVHKSKSLKEAALSVPEPHDFEESVPDELPEE